MEEPVRAFIEGGLRYTTVCMGVEVVALCLFMLLYVLRVSLIYGVDSGKVLLDQILSWLI